MQRKLLSSLLLAATIIPLAEVQGADSVTELETMVITASRQGMAANELTHAVTVIDRKELDRQFQTSRNLGEVLAKTVPGMAPASQTLTNFNQSLRGRNLLVLIDGIPQNTNRNISRDLMNIDVENIERIEVLRGGSAVYGSGAAGGVVNIITRRNEDGATTSLGIQSSLTDIGRDGFGYRGAQSLGGSGETFDYGLNLAWESQSAFFDADGDRIAPEPSQGDLSDTDSLSVAGKLRWFLDSGTLTLSANHLDADQDSDYASDPSVAALPDGSVKARAIPGLQLKEQNRTRNSQINLAWSAEQTPLGSMEAQAYYRNYHARFAPFDGRPFSTLKVLSQTQLDSETWGGRLTLNTELNEKNLLRWGLDLSREKSEGPVTTYDGTTFDSSGGLVFIDTGDRTFMPPITQDNIGAFAQIEHDFNDRLRGELGIRYDYVTASFDNFTTLGQGNAIKGGEVSYDDLLFNTGLVYGLSDVTEVYGSFSQGFELPDIGLRLRSAPAGFNISDSQLEPLKNDNYELGIRGDWDHTQASAAIFYSTSDLGQTSIQNMTLFLPRSKERIYGLELTLDHQINTIWKLGGLMSWMEGERFDEAEQRWEALNGYRIPPLQLRAHIEYTPDNQWFHRLQANYSGARDDAFKDQVGFGSREVKSYTTVDYLANYQIDRRNKLSLGIENLLNKDYFTVYSQLLRNDNNTSHIPASGRTLKVNYTYKW